MTCVLRVPPVGLHPRGGVSGDPVPCIAGCPSCVTVTVVYSSGYLFWIRSLARGGCASGERPPQVPAFMVAGSTGRPMPLIAGRKRVRFLNFLTISAMASADAARSTTAITLPLFPKERPLASEVSDWIDSAKSILPPDQKALIDGVAPRSLLVYTHASVPAALDSAVAGEGPTASRDALRANIEDSNALKTQQQEAHDSEIRDALFSSLRAALKPNAPLFLSKLEHDHKQSGAFAKRFDGVAAWETIADRGETGSQLPGEAANHDAKLTWLDLKPLSDDATPDEFSKRVQDAIVNTFPYLKRPFANKVDESEWVLSQLPERYGAEGRGKFAALSATEKGDPSIVAGMCVDLMAAARPTRSLLKEGPLAEFIGIIDTGGAGRRPKDLRNTPNPKNTKSNPQPGPSAPAPAAPAPAPTRPTYEGCSVPAPRGPMCKHKHGAPCWRDPQWGGPLPFHVARNPAAVASIEGDRLKNATRLGETCVPLTKAPAPPPKESVNVLDVIDDQWPTDVCPEIPIGGPATEKGKSVPVAVPIEVTPPAAPASKGPPPPVEPCAEVKTLTEALDKAVRQQEASQMQVQQLKDMVTKLALGTEVKEDTKEVTPVGTPVTVSGASRADFRVNLTVPANEADACGDAGGVLDAINGVLYAPPRVDLRPLQRWLPFDLAVVQTDPRTGVVPDQRDIPHGAGPVKSDGSPNMSFSSNKRVRDMLTPVRSPKPPLLSRAVPEPAPLDEQPQARGGVAIAAQLAREAREFRPYVGFVFLFLCPVVGAFLLWGSVTASFLAPVIA